MSNEKLDSDTMIENKEDNSYGDSLLSSFKRFAMEFWYEAGTHGPFVDSLTMNCVSAHVDAIFKTKQLKHVIFNFPVRESTSTLLNVILPVYVWLLSPKTNFLTAATTCEYANGLHSKMKELIESTKFQKIFGSKLKLTSKLWNIKTQNEQGGSRLAISFEDKNTATNEDVIIFYQPMRDIHKLEKMSYRDTVKDNFERVIYNGRKNLDTTNLIGLMQMFGNERIFEYLKEKEGDNIQFVDVPMLFKPNKKQITVSPIDKKVIWEDPRTEEDELFSPNIYSVDNIRELIHLYGKVFFERHF